MVEVVPQSKQFRRDGQKLTGLVRTGPGTAGVTSAVCIGHSSHKPGQIPGVKS